MARFFSVLILSIAVVALIPDLAKADEGDSLAATSLAEDDLLDVSFVTISEDMYLIRDIQDSVRACVVYDQDGLDEFWNQYGLDEFGGQYQCAIQLPENFFEKYILVIGFSDRAAAIRADGFKRIEIRWPGLMNSYYLDVHEYPGIAYRRLRPPEGKKYTPYCAIGVDRGLTMREVLVREAIPGPCNQYGTR